MGGGRDRLRQGPQGASRGGTAHSHPCSCSSCWWPKTPSPPPPSGRAGRGFEPGQRRLPWASQAPLGPLLGFQPPEADTHPPRAGGSRPGADPEQHQDQSSCDLEGGDRVARPAAWKSGEGSRSPGPAATHVLLHVCLRVLQRPLLETALQEGAEVPCSLPVCVPGGSRGWGPDLRPQWEKGQRAVGTGGLAAAQEAQGGRQRSRGPGPLTDWWTVFTTSATSWKRLRKDMERFPC